MTKVATRTVNPRLKEIKNFVNFRLGAHCNLACGTGSGKVTPKIEGREELTGQPAGNEENKSFASTDGSGRLISKSMIVAWIFF